MKNYLLLILTLVVFTSAGLPAVQQAAAAPTPGGGKKNEPAKVEPRSGKGKKGGGAEPASPAPSAPAEPAPGGEPSAEPAGGPLRVTGRVVHGEQKGAKAIAVVDVEKCFGVIPSYRKIKEENIKKTKAEYHILIAKANDAFAAAVDQVATREWIDLVVEQGGVSGGGVEPVDITDLVIAELEK